MADRSAPEITKRRTILISRARVLIMFFFVVVVLLQSEPHLFEMLFPAIAPEKETTKMVEALERLWRKTRCLICGPIHTN